MFSSAKSSLLNVRVSTGADVTSDLYYQLVAAMFKLKLNVNIASTTKIYKDHSVGKGDLSNYSEIPQLN